MLNKPYTVEPRLTDTPKKLPYLWSHSTIYATILRTLCLVANVITVCLCTIKTPEMQNSPYSVMQTGFPVPTVPELCKFPRYNQDACLATAFVKSCATFTIRWEIAALTSLTIHYHAHWKHDRSPWNMDTFILWTHSGGPNGVYFRGALLYIHV